VGATVKMWELFDTGLPVGLAFDSLPGFRTPNVWMLDSLICQAMLIECQKEKERKEELK